MPSLPPGSSSPRHLVANIHSCSPRVKSGISVTTQVIAEITVKTIAAWLRTSWRRPAESNAATTAGRTVKIIGAETLASGRNVESYFVWKLAKIEAALADLVETSSSFVWFREPSKARGSIDYRKAVREEPPMLLLPDGETMTRGLMISAVYRSNPLPRPPRHYTASAARVWHARTGWEALELDGCVVRLLRIHDARVCAFRFDQIAARRKAQSGVTRLQPLLELQKRLQMGGDREPRY